ncbi:protein translocase subunit SecF [Thermincola potens]|uniref:Protein-export membrane protein SecF n=1 Tax=Thermincola potens (strain JR) TaxID=635013 RepID=D5XEJ7_THEPJ|nr:protein translocase subunit SecF [Thermincola potens]ADG82068.1 protein-export membrane protein SecF [Thermincola potens JR]
MTLDIIGKRKIWFAISLIIILAGIASMIIKTFTLGAPLNLGIDFTGGNIITVSFTKNVSVSDVRQALDKLDLGNSVIQKTATGEFIIRTKTLTDKEYKQVLDAFKNDVAPYQEGKLSRNEVKPVIGKELTLNAIWALAIASVLMVIYITFRFEFKFGIAAIIALLHDVFVTMGIFSIFWWEVDSAFVAAILTIIGYSINDTIVIFDRIRENLHRKKKDENFEELVNKSIMQTMARSINTVLTVIIVLVALLIFGGSTIRYFTLAMLIGVISGAYSSIFNASPLWVEFKYWEQRRRKLAKT